MVIVKYTSQGWFDNSIHGLCAPDYWMERPEPPEEELKRVTKAKANAEKQRKVDQEVEAFRKRKMAELK